MSTRSSIWLGEKNGKCVHIYWELAEREIEGKMMRAPVYIAADAGDEEKEMVIRLPQAIALKLLRFSALIGRKTLPGSSSRPSGI